jgi:hypothetical protein
MDTYYINNRKIRHFFPGKIPDFATFFTAAREGSGRGLKSERKVRGIVGEYWEGGG